MISNRSLARASRLAGVTGLLTVVAWDARGCTKPPSLTAVPCDTVVMAAPLSGTPEAGEYRLTMVATDGREVSGTLVLREYAPGQQAAAARSPLGSGTNYPLYGRARLSLDSVGATPFGEIDTDSPDAPGVQVMELRDPSSPATRQLLLRFGSDANSGGAATFEGPHTALRIRAAWPDSFAGSWSSSSPDRSVDGHFCARRVAP
jgi:hypothetical protein